MGGQLGLGGCRDDNAHFQPTSTLRQQGPLQG